MRVAVLGAGLQGVCIALALAERGAEIDLFDEQDAALTQASLQNEGKIHLGFVYANDPSLRTARLMAEGALCFAPLLERWTGRPLAAETLSSPFNYLVHGDSLLEPEELERRYRAISAILAETPGDYFGRDVRAPVRRLTVGEFTAAYDDRRNLAAFATPELAVDPEAVALALRARLAATPAVRRRFSTRVIAARDEGDAATVGVSGSGLERERYDHVVNALWSGRLLVDETAGAPLLRPWSFRTKHFLRLRAPAGRLRAPSTTIVLGPFGDVVNYASGDLFLTWYPEGRLAFSTAAEPPSLQLSPAQVQTLRRRIPERLSELVPGLSDLSPAERAAAEVQGGIIYALGDTDVDQPDSLFHQRTRVGPRSFGRYHTVDTGKYTLAPLFAERLAGALFGGA